MAFRLRLKLTFGVESRLSLVYSPFENMIQKNLMISLNLPILRHAIFHILHIYFYTFIFRTFISRRSTNVHVFPHLIAGYFFHSHSSTLSNGGSSNQQRGFKTQ